MAKGKFEYWLTPDGLTLLAAWKRDGLTDEQIAAKCGIGVRTLYTWKDRFLQIQQALTRGRELVDIDVENALLKKCKGYTVELRKTFKVKNVEFDEKTGRKIAEREELVTGIDEMHIPADTQAQQFWLRNRRPDCWKDKGAESKTPGEAVTIIDDI